MIEQGFRIILTVIIIKKYSHYGGIYPSMALVISMTVGEIFSFTLSELLKKLENNQKVKVDEIVDLKKYAKKFLQTL